MKDAANVAEAGRGSERKRSQGNSIASGSADDRAGRGVNADVRTALVTVFREG